MMIIRNYSYFDNDNNQHSAVYFIKKLINKFMYWFIFLLYIKILKSILKIIKHYNVIIPIFILNKGRTYLFKNQNI